MREDASIPVRVNMIMIDNSIEVSVNPPAGTILLNRPEQANALTRPMVRQLIDVLGDLYLEKSVRAIILSGKGDHFCSGRDLAEMDADAAAPDAAKLWGQDAQEFRDLLVKMLELTKPVIAAVHGAARGGGAALALASDIVVATDEASLGFPEPRRGLVSGLAAPLLAFRGGHGVASKLLLTSAPMPASEAYRTGLVHEVVSPDLVWARSMEIAQQCAEGAPHAIQLTKRLITETLAEQLTSQLGAGAIASATSRTAPAAAEGIRAFLDKRPPDWDAPAES